MTDDEFSSTQMKAVIAFVVLAATALIYYFFMMKPSTETDWKSELTSTKISSKSRNGVSTSSDVWEERRKRGVTASSSSGKKAAEDMPFGSSYYYAHNNPNATGGYKDGLRMEDYTMNQPRLLSKGGVPAGESSEAAEAESLVDDAGQTAQPADTTKRQNVPVPKRISKFLWDDPGDSNGIATIRIDTLPGPTLTETVSWREACISNIKTSLIDDKKGLLIELEGDGGTRYCLQIPKLYGQVDEVREVVKPNRLLVRVYKQKSRLNPFDKNLKEWPHP